MAERCTFDRAAIHDIARPQHPLVTRRQLVAAGIASTTIDYHVTRGDLTRAYNGVYVLGPPPLSRETTWLAAVLARGDGALLTGTAAAQLWGITRPNVPLATPTVLSPRRGRPVPGMTLVTTRTLHPHDHAQRQRIPVTSVARTLLEVADTHSPYEVAALIEEAAFQRVLKVRRIEQLLERTEGRHAGRVLGIALQLHRAGHGGTWSTPEVAYTECLLREGVHPDEFVTNARIRFGDGRVCRPDVHVPQLRLVVEIDGGGHRRASTKRDDREKTRRLRANGIQVTRCDADGIEAHAVQLAAVIRSARPRALGV